MGVAAFYDPALIASPAFDKIMASLALGGVSMEAGAIASALTTNRGMTITTRQAAANRQIIYGQQRVGGVMIYESTTGSSHDQYNMVIVLAGHEIDSIENLYLDGRQVFWQGSGDGWSVRNGKGFGGVANSNTYNGPNGQYNFGGTGHSGIYAEARYGDQAEGDYFTSLQANDPNWGPDGKGNTPWVGGCAVIYLKLENNPDVFPNMPPDIKITVNGKNNIWDPRTQGYGYTNNWALIAADIITDPVFGLGDNTVDQLNLISAANVCDEQVQLAAVPGQTESRYTCNYHYDTSVSPGDALAAIMPGANGSISNIGGQWFIWPDYYQGPSFTFGEQHLTSTLQWKPYRSVRDLINRVNGTYIAPSCPWNIAGNLYDANGFYNGILGVATNFPFGFTPTSFPQYAADTLHGFPTDEYLLADGNLQHPLELSLDSVISVTQAQRIAKLNLMHNRQQGEGTLEMGLASFVMQPKDTFYFNFGPFNWVNKLLEVTSVSFKVDEDQASGMQAIRVSYGVRETDPSVYEWTPSSEELTVYDVPASPTQIPLTPAPPTDVALNSGPSVAQVNPDGTVNNIIEVQWNTPQDTSVVQLQIQYQLVGASTWLSAPAADISLNYQWISNVVPGATYNVQIRSTRANGVSSGWVQVLSYTVEATPAFVGTLSALIPQMTPIIGLMPAQAGADVTASQPIVYTGTTSNIIPNGNFILGNTQGWILNGFVYNSDPYGPRIYSPAYGSGGGAISPAFQVVPGEKYRLNYTVYNGSGSGGIYLRLAWQPEMTSNADPNNAAGLGGGYQDFLGSGSVTTTPTVYSYDWQCPAGQYFASVCVYAIGGSDLACQSVSCIPYAAANQWGADVTNQNTAADTSSVDGVPSSTIASVVPTGYKLYINSGNRSYSIQAI